MKRVNIAKQTPLENIQAVADKIRRNHRKTDSEIAFELGMARRTVNEIRHCLLDTPQLFENVQAGKISLYEAGRLRKNNGHAESSNPDSHPAALDRWVNDIRSWVNLTRALLDKTEEVLTQILEHQQKH